VANSFARARAAPERPLGLVVTGLEAEEEEYGYYGYSQSGAPV
jgi:hypothetical protein